MMGQIQSCDGNSQDPGLNFWLEQELSMNMLEICLE
jgi:hypothetical protein